LFDTLRIGRACEEAAKFICRFDVDVARARPGFEQVSE